MELTCKRSHATHWTEILIKGCTYHLSKPYYKETTFITNHKEYFRLTKEIANMGKWETTLNATEKIELLKKYREKNEEKKMFTRTLELPFVKVEDPSDTKMSMELLVNTIEELKELGSDKNLERVNFNNTTYMVDDYFDYFPHRLDQKLNKLLD